jgi:hypothetical protein
MPILKDRHGNADFPDRVVGGPALNFTERGRRRTVGVDQELNATINRELELPANLLSADEKVAGLMSRLEYRLPRISQPDKFAEPLVLSVAEPVITGRTSKR